MDIGNLALVKDTFKLSLRHPVSDEVLLEDGDETKPVTISLYGTASKEYRDAITAMQNRSIKRGKKHASAAVIQEEGVELLVAISDTSEYLEYNGAEVKTPAQFRKLYTDASYSWVREQVDASVGDVANFLAK